MENIEIARTLDEVADLLEIQGANPFRVRAYRTAARTVGALDRPVRDLIADDPDALEALPGIGADLAGKIAGLAKTGRLPLLGQLTRKTPESLVAMLRLPGLGPKRARLIYEKLGVRTLAQLERAARAGKLSTLPGIGPTLEQAILKGIQQDQARGGRFPLAEAEAYVHPLIEALRAAPGVRQIDIAGSMRRRSETVGDVDILVAVARGSTAADRFVHFADVQEVMAEGPTRCAVRLRSGLQVDLRLVPQVSYGAALHSFTGSKAHNIEIRRRGVRRKLKINEYGVFRGSRRIG
ncbi:MAG: helix-hairpin-helix domain-containing protein, partial [Vicinamibacterales bacterium]